MSGNILKRYTHITASASGPWWKRKAAPSSAVRELGFIIGVLWQRKGYAREVCRAVLAYASAALEFTKVQALVETGNAASLELCRQLGFHRDSEVTLKGREYYLLLKELPG